MNGSRALVLLLAGCGSVVEQTGPGFTLAAGPAEVRTGETATLAVTVVVEGSAPSVVTVSAVGLPDGVIATPASIAAGAEGTVELTADTTATQGYAAFTVRGESAFGAVDLPMLLLVRGGPGTLDPTWGADVHAGTIAAISADVEGRIVTCANVPNALSLRRFTRDGTPETGWAQQGELSRLGTCVDVLARDDGSTVMLFVNGTIPSLLVVDATGETFSPESLPTPPDTTPEAVALVRDGDRIIVVGTISGAMPPTRAGLWRLDAALDPDPSFSDGTGTPGFAAPTTSPYPDARTADVVVRANGSLLGLTYATTASTGASFELNAGGQTIPGTPTEYDLFGLDHRNLRAIGLPEDRIVLTGGATNTQFGMLIGDRSFAQVRTLALAPSPAVGRDLARHPDGGAVVVGEAAGQLAWRRVDAVQELPDRDFEGAWEGATSGRCVAPLPDGSFAIGADAPGGFRLVHLWD